MSLIFSIVLGAEYLSYVKFIATYALTFFGYIISVLASVCCPCLLYVRTMLFLGSWHGYIAQKVKLFERLTMTWPPTNDKWKKADRKTMCLLCSKVIKVVKQNSVL